MVNVSLVVVLLAAGAEAGFMAWGRLFSFQRTDLQTAPPPQLRWAFDKLKYAAGGLVGISALAAILLGTPVRHFGVDPTSATSFGEAAVFLGLVLGITLYVLTELLIPTMERLGLSYDPGYGEIGPSTFRGWARFLGVELPLVSLREELIYRIALIGVAASVFSVSPWLTAILSTAVFGSIHLSGKGGFLITLILGGCLAIAFVLTNSLLLVVIAHTIVNGVEFVVHDGFDVEPGRQLFETLG